MLQFLKLAGELAHLLLGAVQPKDEIVGLCARALRHRQCGENDNGRNDTKTSNRRRSLGLSGSSQDRDQDTYSASMTCAFDRRKRPRKPLLIQA